MRTVEVSGPVSQAVGMIKQAISDGNQVVVSFKGMSLDEEAELKKRAFEKGLLFLGPSCKTSILDGNGFGVWNSLKRGPIGIVSSSGSGLREISCLVNEVGVSHALQVGERDMSQKVGALGTLGSLRFLAEDESTEIIVLAAYPTTTAVEKMVLNAMKATGKKCVACFLGEDNAKLPKGIVGAQNLEMAAERAVQLAGHEGAKSFFSREMLDIARSERENFGYGQKYIRGVFTGKMLCVEAQLVLSEFFSAVRSNAPLKPRLRMSDPHSSSGYSCVNVSAPELARGIEPAVEPEISCDRILKEAQNWDTAVVLFDMHLGNGAHQDPAKKFADAIKKAKKKVENSGGYLSVIASVVGTARDPQGLASQLKKLEDSGAILARSNAQAARMAAFVAKKTGASP